MRVAAMILTVLVVFIELIFIIIAMLGPAPSMWILVVLLAVPVFGLHYSLHLKKKKEEMEKQARKAWEEARNTPYMEQVALSAIQRGELPVVVSTPIILGDGEVAHYYAPATKYVTKSKAIGRTGGGAGVSVRIAKGVSVRTGSSSSRTVYGDVTETYNGDLVLTNKRLVFIESRAGFECRLSRLTAVTPGGGSVVVQAGSKTYRFSVAQQDLFLSVLSVLIRK